MYSAGTRKAGSNVAAAPISNVSYSGRKLPIILPIAIAEAGGRRTTIGPAAPPPELLAAAAQIPWEEDEEDVEDLIGPAPPEMAEELEGVGGDERVAEVARVIRYSTEQPWQLRKGSNKSCVLNAKYI